MQGWRVVRPTKHHFRSAHLVPLHHLEPGSRESLYKDDHWPACLPKSPSYVPFSVTFLMTAPGLASQLSAFLGQGSRTNPQYRTLVNGNVPLAAVVHMLGSTDLDVSPLALRAQPYKLTAYATIMIGTIVKDGLEIGLARLQAVVNGDTCSMRTLSDDAAIP